MSRAPLDDVDVVEVQLCWELSRELPSGRTVLGLKHVKAGHRFALGERGDLLLPADVLGVDRFEILRRDGQAATLTVPPGAGLRVDGRAREERTLEIEQGQVIELTFGRLVVRLARVPLERAGKGAPMDGLPGRGTGFVAGSALFHAAVFGIVALFAPPLGATEEDSFDPDRMALLQRMLDASAQRELVHPAEDAPVTAGGDTSGGKPAQLAEGEAGRPDTTHGGRYAARGTARPNEATLPRERALAEASSFGVISAIAGIAASDPNTPVVPWGTALDGSDDQSQMGHLFGATIDDARGVGGLGFSGLEESGGGTSNSIGLKGFGPLGHTGSCAGPGPCDGIGHDRGHTGGVHVPHFKAPRYGDPVTNGRLAPEVIRRIVRLNDGRYRFCYQNALRTDPNLQGRVTVKFMIDRSGAVAFAADGGSDIPDEGVRRCVVSSFLGLSFPQPDNGTVSVVYPIVFSPE
jgi:hypothetical protein